MKLVVIIVGSLCLALIADAHDQHRALQRGAQPVRRVLVVPPGVTVVRQGIAGTEPLDAETAALLERLTNAAAAALLAKGRTVLPNPFTREALLQDDQLRYELADLQARYDLQAPAMHRDGKAVQRGEFTLGREVASLNRDGQADALVMLRAYGADPTLAKRVYALSLPFGGTAFSTLYLSLALLDARTGEVLYLARKTLRGDLRNAGKADKLLAKGLAQALRKLPVNR